MNLKKIEIFRILKERIESHSTKSPLNTEKIFKFAGQLVDFFPEISEISEEEKANFLYNLYFKFKQKHPKPYGQGYNTQKFLGKIREYKSKVSNLNLGLTPNI